MPVTFTATRALLSTMATTLSTEATLAGLSSLSTALTNLSTEIETTNSAITEQEFFGGGSTSFSASGGSTGSGGSASGSGTDKDSAALVWTQSLMAASNIIATKNINSIRDHFVANDSTKFWQNFSSITGDIQNISGKQTTIAEKQTTIAEKQTTIAEKQTAIETYQKKLKELGEADGIHMIGPYDWIGLISIYKLLVEQGAIVDDEKGLTKSAKAANVEILKTYLQKIKSLPTNF